jgi:hypothetical protein
MLQLGNTLHSARNGNSVLLLNPIDAAIGALAKLRKQKGVVRLSLKDRLNRLL